MTAVTLREQQAAADVLAALAHAHPGLPGAVLETADYQLDQVCVRVASLADLEVWREALAAPTGSVTVTPHQNSPYATTAFAVAWGGVMVRVQAVQPLVTMAAAS